MRLHVLDWLLFSYRSCLTEVLNGLSVSMTRLTKYIITFSSLSCSGFGGHHDRSLDLHRSKMMQRNWDDSIVMLAREITLYDRGMRMLNGQTSTVIDAMH